MALARHPDLGPRLHTGGNERAHGGTTQGHAAAAAVRTRIADSLPCAVARGAGFLGARVAPHGTRAPAVIAPRGLAVRPHAARRTRRAWREPVERDVKGSPSGRLDK